MIPIPKTYFSNKKKRSACGVRTGLNICFLMINKLILFKNSFCPNKKKRLRRTHWPKKRKLINKIDFHFKNPFYAKTNACGVRTGLKILFLINKLIFYQLHILSGKKSHTVYALAPNNMTLVVQDVSGSILYVTAMIP